jgi:hypothetical protein
MRMNEVGVCGDEYPLGPHDSGLVSGLLEGPQWAGLVGCMG